MKSRYTHFTGKMGIVLSRAAEMEKSGRVTMKGLSVACGYDQAGDIAAEVNYLEQHGYVERHGKRGSRDVHLTVLKGAPNEIKTNIRKDNRYLAEQKIGAGSGGIEERA